LKQTRINRKINWFAFGLIGLVFIAVGAYFWVTDLMDSAQAYRSPIAKSAPVPGQLLGVPITRRMVIVLIDALRFDTSANSTVMPFLNELRDKGASAIIHSRPPSFSAPGWTTLLTGAWPDINDSQPFNPPDESSARPFSQDDIFAAAHRSHLKTAVSGYSWFQGMLSNSDLDAGFFTPGEDNNADIKVVSAALPWLSEDYRLILIHLDQVDFAGHHEGGPRSPNWDAAATRADDMLRQISSRLDLSQDTLLVVSDHGQIDRGGHGGPEPITLIEPFVLAGAGVIPGNYGDVAMVDIAPTISVFLGTNIPASNQGNVLVKMLTLSANQNASIQEALNSQQNQLFSLYTKAIGVKANIGIGESVLATQTAMDLARQTRLGNERIWRNVLATFLAVLPGYILFQRKERKALWLLSGALIYILLFNLRYAVIDGRTYSLASVESATWLIMYSSTTAAVAAFLGWFFPMLGLHAFKSGARKAADTALGYVWITIYLLAFPILINFAINGLLVTWTLPEFYSLFIGLLSLIQVLIVAALGIILVGISAGVGWLYKR
jgi:hypothetical protein